MPRTLVTGATGFIGRHLVASLLEAGQEVVAMGRFSERDPSALDWLDRSPAWRSDQLARQNRDRLEVVTGDVRDRAAVDRAIGSVDQVVHLAAAVATRSEKLSESVNVGGTRTVAEAAVASPKKPVLLAVSSLAAAGPCVAVNLAEPQRNVAEPGARLPVCPKVESDLCHPVSLYGRTKLRGERVLAEFAGDLPITIVRPPCVVGPGDRNLLKLCQSLVTSWNLVLSKTDLYSFISVVDLVPGIIEALARGERLTPVRRDASEIPESGGEREVADPGSTGIDPTHRGVYYLTDPHPVTFVELADWIAEDLGRSRRLRHLRVPATVGWLVGAGGEIAMRCFNRNSFLNFDKIREGLAGSWVCGGQRAEQELGFVPRANLRTRVAETINDYQQSEWL